MTDTQGPISGRHRDLSRRARIADVAAAAGVGVGTVSRVLNGNPHVRPDTRQRVLAAIEQAGYRPSRLAVGLSRGTPKTVAILVPFLTRPSVVARLAGVIEVLDAAGYDAIVCNVESPAQRDHQVAMLAERHRAAGIIVISLPLAPPQLAALAEAGLPMVFVDVAAPGLPHLVVDDVAGGAMATRHLLDLGHRRIAFIGDAPRNGFGFTSTADRARGYRRALRTAGIPVDPGLVLRKGAYGAAAAAEHAATLLRLPDPPTAVFAASDDEALGVLAAADALGLAVPEQLSVIGFDDVETATYLDLSTVHQPLRDSGARGAALLCRLLRGEAVMPLREQLPLQVVARGSTGPPTLLPTRRSPPHRMGTFGSTSNRHTMEGSTTI